ncbi:MAG: P1 family peptidase [Ignavibacteria bacterium]|nr:P1 family peptidase [Ignavibacteria bacterium]
MATAVPGFKLGHVSDQEALTGCTVILCPPKTRGSCDVRGNSPGSRELSLLAPEKSMQEVHAILLTGGSAFGLRAADGVVQWLLEHSIGYQTPWAKVPIVPGAVIFDLNVGSNTTWPTAEDGYDACSKASDGPIEEGNVGAGTGAMVGKWRGIEFATKGGFGSASASIGDLIVHVVAVVNAVGDVVDKNGTIIAGARDKHGIFVGSDERVRKFARGGRLETSNTTLVVAATNASLTKLDCHKVSQRMHDGMARAIVPVHTTYDGDVTFTLSHGVVSADLDLVAELAADLTAEAIRRGVSPPTGDG